MSEAITILRRWYDSDLAYSFRQSPAVMISAFVALTIILAAILPRWWRRPTRSTLARCA